MKIINIDRLKKSILEKRNNLKRGEIEDGKFYGLNMAMDLINENIIEINEEGFKQIKKMAKHNRIAIFIENESE